VGTLAETDFGHRFPRVADVVGGPPKISADVCAPSPDVAIAVFANAVDDRSAAVCESASHLQVSGAQVFRRVAVNSRGAAPVMLEEIDAPRREGFRVLFLMAVAALITAARARTGRTVEAELETARMNVVGER